MNKALLLLSILIMLAESFYSCKPEGGTSPNQTSFPLPKEIKDYMYFRPGTFWIYKDSATNIIDTVTVTDTVVVPVTTSDGKYYEQYQTNTYSTYYEYYFYHSINTSWSEKCITANESRPCYSIKHIKTRPGNFVGENYLVFLPFQKNYWGYASIGTDNSIVKTTDIFESVSANPFTFSKVIQVNTSNNFLYDGAETNFFIAKNVGLVRKEITPKQGNKIVWLLVDYSIVQ